MQQILGETMLMNALIIALFLLFPLCLVVIGIRRKLTRARTNPVSKKIIFAVGIFNILIFEIFGDSIAAYLYGLYGDMFFLYAFLYICYMGVLDLIQTIVLLILLHKRPRIRDFTLPLVLVISWLLAKLIPR